MIDLQDRKIKKYNKIKLLQLWMIYRLLSCKSELSYLGNW